MKLKIVNFLKKLLFFFPSKLPSGLAQFDAFAQDIIDVYGLPDNDSFKWVVAYQLQHLDADKDYKWMKFLFGNAYASKRRIYLEIRGAESRQTAGEVFRIIKERQMAAAAAQAGQTSPTSAPVAATPATALSVVRGPEGS